MEIQMESTDMKNCDDCMLFLKRTQVVMPTPCLTGGLLAIGEAPGADEDIAGEGFVGRAGKTLDKLLLAHGIKRQDYGRANICRCRPVDANGKNRKPTPREIDACLPKLAEFIGETQPGVILCVGMTAAKFFCQAESLTEAIRLSPISYTAGTFGAPFVLKHLARDCHVVVMPHTSPLAFNRKSPDGKKWADVAAEQVALAVKLARANC